MVRASISVPTNPVAAAATAATAATAAMAPFGGGNLFPGNK